MGSTLMLDASQTPIDHAANAETTTADATLTLTESIFLTTYLFKDRRQS